MIYQATFSDGTTVHSRELKSETIAFAWLAEFRNNVRFGFTSEKSLAHRKADAAIAKFAADLNTTKRGALVEVVDASPHSHP